MCRWQRGQPGLVCTGLPAGPCSIIAAHPAAAPDQPCTYDIIGSDTATYDGVPENYLFPATGAARRSESARSARSGHHAAAPQTNCVYSPGAGYQCTGLAAGSCAILAVIEGPTEGAPCTYDLTGSDGQLYYGVPECYIVVVAPEPAPLADNSGDTGPAGAGS